LSTNISYISFVAVVQVKSDGMGKMKVKISKPNGANRSKQKVGKLPQQQRAKDSWKAPVKVVKSVVKRKSEEQIAAIDRISKKHRPVASTGYGIKLAPSALMKFNKAPDSTIFVAKYDEKHLAAIAEEPSEEPVQNPVRPAKPPVKVVISNRFNGLKCDSDSDDEEASTIKLQPSALHGLLRG
jgi:hypothetical protein